MESASEENQERFRISIRMRPLNTREKILGAKQAVFVNEDHNKIYVHSSNDSASSGNLNEFTFDHVYGELSSQRQVYVDNVKPLVEDFCNGYNAAIFCYGQAGTGKTHNLQGVTDSPSLQGIIQRSVNDIFTKVCEYPKILIKVSFFMICSEQWYDLLQDHGESHWLKNGDYREAFFAGKYTATCASEVMEYHQKGINEACVWSTNMGEMTTKNTHIFQITLDVIDKDGDNTIITNSTISFVDLPDSARINRAGIGGQRLKEMTRIECARRGLPLLLKSLSKKSQEGDDNEKKVHIPYRNFKLTFYMKQALGNNCKTLILGTIGPADLNAEETLQTLKLLDKAKLIINYPRLVINAKSSVLTRLRAVAYCFANDEFPEKFFPDCIESDDFPTDPCIFLPKLAECLDTKNGDEICTIKDTDIGIICKISYTNMKQVITDILTHIQPFKFDKLCQLVDNCEEEVQKPNYLELLRLHYKHWKSDCPSEIHLKLKDIKTSLTFNPS
ncbi:unnamed protein product [Moneuplotes crassus]|uniref:Kinesin motor domain-containing protein n=1 Tax=Euplotes crassus TaxID=5936 RepID=A0AAD1X826_EUPCR|nr:unnamed protein product [Moneuplotes crassus]